MSLFDKLPKVPFLTQENSDQENFFALEIGFDKVTAAVWTINSHLQILNSATVNYDNGDDFKSEESLNSLLDGANLALDQALANILPEPSKLLFGVPDSWLEDENLKADYLKILKTMVKELGVEPMAYVSTTHALAHLLQKQQGVPLSAVLLEVADPLVIAVVKSGRTLGFTTKVRGTKISSDIEQALLALSEIEVFPSKFLLYGQDDQPVDELAKVKDELSSHAWMEQVPFLHLPKVELLPNWVEIQAVCFAGAFELNPQISTDIGLSNQASQAHPQLSHQLPVEKEIAKDVRRVNEAGFVEGDISQMSNVRAPRSEEFKESDYPAEESTEFLEQEDWVDQPDQRHLARYDKPHFDLIAALMSPLAALTKGGQTLAKPGASPASFLTILVNKLVIVPILLLILLGGLLFFIPKAQVLVFVDMKPLENSAQIIADPTITQADPDNNKIPGKIVEADVNGSLEGQASGKKQVGDPAKGKVVIYNATSQSVNLSKGTVLATANGKKFTLENGVQVASKSASAAEPPTRSDTVDATAADIGPEGNIAAGTDLNVASFNKSDVVAKVDTAFSGGVSKEVQVVTADDQTKLLASLTDQLKQKAKDQLQNSLSGDMKVLPESFSEKILKKNYSKDVGDQAAKFTLTVTAHYKGTAYSDSDLKALVSKLVQTKVPDPDHYTLDLSETETQAEVAKVEPNGKLYFNAKFKAKLRPKLDLEKLKGKIAGKNVEQAKQILKDSEQQIIGADIKLSPYLPGPFKFLPFRKENISIEVTAK